MRSNKHKKSSHSIHQASSSVDFSQVAKSSGQSNNSINSHSKGGGGGGGGPGANAKWWSKISFASTCMWILNIGLIVCSVFALSNWTAINWMTGSYGWAALLEIGALLLLMYLFLVGTCLMGWSGRVSNSFVHFEDSPQLLYLFALALPFMVVSFFGTLALLSLSNLNATNLFVATHAEAVWKAASLYARDITTGISVEEFMKYICSLPSFITQCTWFVQGANATGDPPKYEFQYQPSIPTNADGSRIVDGKTYPFFQELSMIFDAMVPKDANNRLMVEHIYTGIHSSLAPYKQRFGWSVLAITIICVIQFGYYWYKWNQYQKTSRKNRDSEQEPLAFSSP